MRDVFLSPQDRRTDVSRRVILIFVLVAAVRSTGVCIDDFVIVSMGLLMPLPGNI